MNAHEGRARLVKVLALVEAIDDLNAKPRVDATALARAVRDQDPSWWHALADSAGVRAPSETTRAAVLEILDRRALRERLVDDTEPMLSAERDTRPTGAP